MQNSEETQPEDMSVAAKLKLVTAMLSGADWQVAAHSAGLSTSRTAAYRLLKGFREAGLSALYDGRQGHPSKLNFEIQSWLVDYCRTKPAITSRQLQTALQEHFGVTASISRLNELRAKLEVSRQRPLKLVSIKQDHPTKKK